jgi:hypothetical protein
LVARSYEGSNRLGEMVDEVLVMAYMKI